MSLEEENASGGLSSLGLIAAACLVALGLGAGGYFGGAALLSGMGKLRPPHAVSVKGLAEKPVKADLALWPLRFVATGNDLVAVQATIAANQKAVTEFLKEQGLNDNELTVERTDVVDLMAREYRNDAVHDNRFILYGNVMIRSGNVDQVQIVSRKLGELVKAGVVFTTEGGGGSASLSPYYLFTKLNDVKLAMLSEATRNARAAAEQFARDAGVPLGDLLQANQGVISILPGDAVPNASEESQINKTVRVVATVQYVVGN